MSSHLFQAVNQDELDVILPFLKDAPVPVGSIAKALGLKVTKSTLGPKISGLIAPSDDAAAGFEIKVNRYEVSERQRFTIAHEIAHFLLHKEHIGSGVVDNVLYRSNLSSKRETEANQLAAELIMPRELVRTEIQRAGSVDARLAERLAVEFKVSIPAMRVRLGLGL